MVGGVMRDSMENWFEGFRKYMGRGFALKSELWVILIGLEVAQLRKYRKIIVESDCLDVIEMIMGNLMMTLIR